VHAAREFLHRRARAARRIASAMLAFHYAPGGGYLRASARDLGAVVAASASASAKR
jgi:hypothetical protein